MNLKEMSTSVLMHLENDIRRELSYRKYHEGYKQGQFDASMDSVAKITPVTPQQQRDAIVEQAKADVADLHDNGLVRFNFGVRRLEFVVNPEKRTVVALLRGFINGNVRGKGIAKCAPTDCFNAQIGKAIALRRALGLEVHSEYLSAPQPTEVRVGDVIKTLNGKIFEIKKIRDNASAVLRSFMTGERSYLLSLELSKVIDDTREGVDGK